MHEILRDRLNDIVHKSTNEEEFENNKYFETVLEKCVNPYVNNIRDVNRLLNAFRFKYGALWKETSFVDLLAITAIEIFEPKLYKWIAYNKNALCECKEHTCLMIENDGNKYLKQCNEKFSNLGFDFNRVIDILSTLFTRFAKDINKDSFVKDLTKKHSTKYQSEEELTSKMRVGSAEKFDLYFSFNLWSIKIPREEIIKCANSYSNFTLRQKIKNFNKDGNIILFLDNIEALALDNEILNNRLALIASIIFELQYEFKDPDPSVFYNTSATEYSERILSKIVACIDKENDRYEIISSAVKNINRDNVGTTSTIIRDIGFAYRKYGCKDERKDSQFISLKHLEDIEKIYAAKIKSISKSEDILSSYQFRIAFYVWKCINKKDAVEYITNLFDNDIDKLKFLCLTTYNSLTGWKFSSENCFNLVSEEEFYASIKNFDKSRLDEFTKEEQIILASFVVNYENNSDDFNHATEREALRLIEKWKSESSLAKQ